MPVEPQLTHGKRERASKIIATAASASAASTALCSLAWPTADTAVSTVIVQGMVVGIGKLFGVAVDEATAAKIVALIAGNVPAVAGARAVLTFIPGLGAGVSFAYITALGWKAYKYFETQASSTTESPHKSSERKPLTVRDRAFICYCHEDVKYVNEFKKYLKCYAMDGLLDFFCDKDIVAGADWQSAIRAALMKTRVAICFLSPNFLVSHFIRDFELPALLDGVEKEGVVSFSILVSPTPKTEVLDKLLRYQSPVPLEPIRRMRPVEREETYKVMAETVASVLEGGKPTKATSKRAD